MEWKTIDSAPKDGTEFSGWFGKYGFEPRCRYDPETEAFQIWGRVDYDNEDWDVYPHMTATHWVIITAPPQAQEE